MTLTETGDPLPTPLYDLHRKLNGRLVDFAGYHLPVRYTGILAEHDAVREGSGLFDVSHMGQVHLTGPDFDTVAASVERLSPSNVCGLKPGQTRYSVLLNETGGIIDDFMVTRPAGSGADTSAFLVLNASRKHVDIAAIKAVLPSAIALRHDDSAGLLALQGPTAGDVMAAHVPATSDMRFMEARSVEFAGLPVHVTRSGYTGEDGFEISTRPDHAMMIAEALLATPGVVPIGLGARDSLRLEAGLCLHGHDIDETTSPVEAGLNFVIARRRRELGDFPGASRILEELASGPARRRVGLVLDGRAPAREGTLIVSRSGEQLGQITSGGFAPTLQRPIAMGYVTAGHAAPGTSLKVIVRGKELAATVSTMPFVEQRYRR